MIIERILEYSTYCIFSLFIIYLILECIGLPRPKREDNVKSPLYYPSITEKGIEAKEVFQTLEKNKIKPNYLGMED